MRVRDLAFTSGSLTEEMMGEWEVLERRCLSLTAEKTEDAYDTCGEMFEFLWKMDGGVDLSDLRYYGSNSSISNQRVVDYL